MRWCTIVLEVVVDEKSNKAEKSMSINSADMCSVKGAGNLNPPIKKVFKHTITRMNAFQNSGV
jgi:hypothetical protein